MGNGMQGMQGARKMFTKTLGNLLEDSEECGSSSSTVVLPVVQCRSCEFFSGGSQEEKNAVWDHIFMTPTRN